MNLAFRIAFSSLRGMNPAVASMLLEQFGSEEAFFRASERHLLSLAKGRPMAMFSDSYRAAQLEKARREEEYVIGKNIRTIYFADTEEYPARLGQCPDAPLMLYTLGADVLSSRHMLAIVGTRHATPYGVNFVGRLVAELAERVDDLVIVSGLAYGIDAAAHRAAIEAGVPTVGVLAHGLSQIYPAAHRQLAARMVHDGGALVTEYTSDAPVHRANFLTRNRIVAGLSDCVMVAESAGRGGALATARIAQDYGREVAALPGRVSDPYSEGCNRLISGNVAALVTSTDDLMAMLGWESRQAEGAQPALPMAVTTEQQAVVDALSGNPSGLDINTLSIATGMPVATLMPLLVDMEFDGLLMVYPGGRYMPV